MIILSEYLRELRDKNPIKYVAEKTGISAAYLSHLECGKRINPHFDILRKLATFYDVPLGEFLKKAGYLDGDINEEVCQNNKTPTEELNALCRGYGKLSEEQRQEVMNFLQYNLRKRKNKK